MYPKHSTTSSTHEGNRFTEVHHEVHHEVHYENQPFFRTGRPQPVGNRNGYNRQTEMPDPENSLVILNDYLEPLVTENTQTRDNPENLDPAYLPFPSARHHDLWQSLGLSNAFLHPRMEKTAFQTRHHFPHHRQPLG